MNVISAEEGKTLWLPWATFDNIEQKNEYELTDQPESILIISHPDFKFTMDARTNIRNTRLFKGSENIISYWCQFTVNWICAYHMQWYPFDTQKCTMEIFPPSSSISFHPTFVNYSGPWDLPQHFVKMVKISPLITSDKSGVKVEVYLGRPLFGTVLSVFMPTTILLLLSQMVRIFGKDHLEMAIEVNLTLLLVLATL